MGEMSPAFGAGSLSDGRARGGREGRGGAPAMMQRPPAPLRIALTTSLTPRRRACGARARVDGAARRASAGPAAHLGGGRLLDEFVQLLRELLVGEGRRDRGQRLEPLLVGLDAGRNCLVGLLVVLHLLVLLARLGRVLAVGLALPHGARGARTSELAAPVYRDHCLWPPLTCPRRRCPDLASPGLLVMKPKVNCGMGRSCPGGVFQNDTPGVVGSVIMRVPLAADCQRTRSGPPGAR